MEKTTYYERSYRCSYRRLTTCSVHYISRIPNLYPGMPIPTSKGLARAVQWPLTKFRQLLTSFVAERYRTFPSILTNKSELNPRFEKTHRFEDGDLFVWGCNFRYGNAFSEIFYRHITPQKCSSSISIQSRLPLPRSILSIF
jgi:hypothetical protein